MYKLTQNGVIRLIDNALIPNDPANRDFQEFQKWFAEGNKPIPEYVPEECINPETYEVDENCVFQKIKEQKKKEILALENNRVNQIVSKYEYISLADIQLYASQNDTEAQAILSWYQTYDDLIWSWIDQILQVATDLQSIDVKAVEKDLFNQSMQTNPLP